MTPDTLSPAAQKVLSNVASWQQGTTSLVDLYTSNDAPFTSGHVVRELRTFRPDLAFRQRSVGEHVQEMYWNQQIVYQGGIAVQVPRTTTGKGRTPAGQDVFVYGPDSHVAYSLDFEIDIPVAGAKAPPSSPQSPQPPPQGASSPADYRCAVHSDRRLCVPRAALNALSAKRNKNITHTTEAWVSLDGDQAIVSFDPHSGAVNYALSASRGRVLFAKPGAGQFEPGTMYQGKLDTVSTLDSMGNSVPLVALVVDLSTEI